MDRQLAPVPEPVELPEGVQKTLAGGGRGLVRVVLAEVVQSQIVTRHPRGAT